MKASFLATLTLASAVLIAGCSSTPPVQMPAAPAPIAHAPMPVPPPAPVARTAPAPAATVVPEYLDPKSRISTERSVYFDFDDFSVKSQYASLLERHGKYLAANPRLVVRIEGNADERGGTEYNLALGQKRAEAVVKALGVYGVRSNQMEAVSWGKERPKAMGHDDAARAQNRRVDIQYPKQ